MRAIAELSLRAHEAPATVPDDPPRADARLDVLAARHGDRASMRAIYEAEAPALVRRLRHLTGDLAHAQDLAHDVFVVAFSGRAPFHGGPLSTWLYGIALNRWRNDKRKSKRRRALMAARPTLAAGGVDPSEAVEIDEMQRRFDAALAELPIPLREAFVLRVLEALPLHEAARLAGVSQPTMSKRASKAEALVRVAIESTSDREEPR